MDEKEISPVEIENAFLEAEKAAEILQKNLLHGAEQAGFARAAFHQLRPFYRKLAENTEEYPMLAPIVCSGANLAGTITESYKDVFPSFTAELSKLNIVTGSLVTMVSATSAYTDLIPKEQFDLEQFEPPPVFVQDEERVYERLSQIDTSLASTYLEVGQAFHATSADPSRAALSLMRQTIDHFFAVLSPDDEVRKSPYWKQKKGSDFNLVTRKERFVYAINTHIHNEKMARILFDSIDVVLESYQHLNNLHKRGALSEKQSYRALKTTKSFIETWLDALSDESDS